MARLHQRLQNNKFLLHLKNQQLDSSFFTSINKFFFTFLSCHNNISPFILVKFITNIFNYIKDRIESSSICPFCKVNYSLNFLFLSNQGPVCFFRKVSAYHTYPIFNTSFFPTMVWITEIRFFYYSFCSAKRSPASIRLSCERACPVSPLEPVVRWRQSTFSIIFFAIASK